MKKSFNPLIFLASLGAGGISVAPFTYFQYIVHKGEGLITNAQLQQLINSSSDAVFFHSA
ncbi:MAG: hypothetical protein IPO21_10515 [Bacteroidales bacterium]|nr:hypothetical protein [Bacteroidales bacterium]